jgi:hypothetical protein
VGAPKGAIHRRSSLRPSDDEGFSEVYKPLDIPLNPVSKQYTSITSFDIASHVVSLKLFEKLLCLSFPPRSKYGVNSGGNPEGFPKKLDSCFCRNDGLLEFDYNAPLAASHSASEREG